MPLYLYQNPYNSKDVVEIAQSMNEPHTYSKDGVEYIRVFVNPYASIDSVNIDPFSQSHFSKKTDARGTLGDLFDRSKDLSEKRKNKLGFDPVLEKHYESYASERNGKVHPDVKKRKLKEYIKKSKLFTID